MQRGWCLGSERFREELLAQGSERQGDWHYGAELGESAQAKAERLLAAELARVGWTEADLASRRKGGPGEAETRGEAAGGNDDDVGMDCEAVAVGHARTPDALLYHHERPANADTSQSQLWQQI